MTLGKGKWLIFGVVSHPEMDRQLPCPLCYLQRYGLLQATEAEPDSDSEDCVILFDSNRMIEAGVPPEVSRDLSHCQIYVLQQ